jgi:hypothetical protein
VAAINDSAINVFRILILFVRVVFVGPVSRTATCRPSGAHHFPLVVA